MSDPRWQDVTDFEQANPGNVLILISKAFGRELMDEWIMRSPPPWSPEYVDDFSLVLTESLKIRLGAEFKTRRSRRAFKAHSVALQAVAMRSALDRIKEHALSGFAGGTA